MAATSTTSSVDTLIPPSNRLSTPTRSSMALIIGPPPCTTTMRSPSFWSVATSWQKSVASSGVVMALPPYFTTMVCPAREEIEEEIVMAFSAKDDESVEYSDVDDVLEMNDFWCSNDVDDDIDGANACDVLASAAARRMVLAENNSFMVVAIS
mmetsp:Transcript_19440/g.30393  ORF Transcript_19440/g.30393 Transcript_19440/m.30393 type:complete len:153 (-) Transcript_19440:57-515(-)